MKAIKFIKSHKIISTVITVSLFGFSTFAVVGATSGTLFNSGAEPTQSVEPTPSETPSPEASVAPTPADTSTETTPNPVESSTPVVDTPTPVATPESVPVLQQPVMNDTSAPSPVPSDEPTTPISQVNVQKAVPGQYQVTAKTP